MALDSELLVDRDQGCEPGASCPLPVPTVGLIVITPDGNDVELDWTDDPIQGTRFLVYKLVGPQFDQAVRIGSTDGRTFVHTAAMLSEESFSYRVSAVDSCGNESALE